MSPGDKSKKEPPEEKLVEPVYATYCEVTDHTKPQKDINWFMAQIINNLIDEVERLKKGIK